MNERFYFLGGASPGGFRTPAAKLINGSGCFTYIIKGTAGSGKSTLMKRAASAFPDEEKDIYLCSADPLSYDAVHFKKRNIIIADGTAPHVFEPVYPYASQALVDLGACLDSGKLYERRDEIIAVTDEYSGHHVRCRRYLTALASIAADMENIGKTALLSEKLSGFTERIARRLIHGKSTAQRGSVIFRQISAITPNGYITHTDSGCESFVINDEYFAASDKFLRSIAEKAAERGHDVVVSESYLHTEPKYEAVLIPSANAAFYVRSPLSEPEPKEYTGLSFRRFYSSEVIGEKKQRIKFDLRACADLISESVNSLKRAKEVHDKLESIYISAADHEKADKAAEKLIAEISERGEVTEITS